MDKRSRIFGLFISDEDKITRTLIIIVNNTKLLFLRLWWMGKIR